MTTQKCNRCKVNLAQDKFKQKRCGNYQKNCIDCNKRGVEYDKKKPKKFVCNLCVYKCKNNHILQNHIKAVHKKDKSFSCLQCKTTFGLKSNLKAHIQAVHTEENAFACIQCEKKFARKGDLTTHINSVHTNEKRFSCIQCENKFSRNADLQRHINSVHTNEKQFSCTQCEYKCSQLYNLQRHVKICTGVLNISGGELACRKSLELLGYEYKTEVCIIKNGSDNWLRFDFEVVINDKPRYIEFDGEAHYKPIRFGGMSAEKAEDAFIKQQLHDSIKNEYCETNNIPLLRIPYMRIDETMILIKEFLH